MNTRLLIMLGIFLVSSPLVFAGEITSPQRVIYPCLQLPSTFKVGEGTYNGSTFWWVDTVEGISKDSVIKMSSADTYKYTANLVFYPWVGNTKLQCEGFLTFNGKPYKIVVHALVIENTCDANSDKITFTCKP